MQKYEYNVERYGKSEVIDTLESVIAEFNQYEQLAGSDGLLSTEIYRYLIGLHELLNEIERVEEETIESL